MSPRLPLLSTLALLCACVDYGIHKQRDDNPGVERDPIPDEAHVGPVTCPEPEAPPIDVVADDTCAFEPQDGTLDVRVEWHLEQFEVLDHAAGAFATTVGDVDLDGVPDIVVVTVEDGGGPGGSSGGGSGGSGWTGGGTGGTGGSGWTGGGTGGTGGGTGGTGGSGWTGGGTGGTGGGTGGSGWTGGGTGGSGGGTGGTGWTGGGTGGTGGGTGGTGGSSGGGPGGGSGGGGSGGGTPSQRPFEQGVLRVISGDGQRVHWSRPQWNWQGHQLTPTPLSTVALGDVDDDGQPELVLTMLRDRTGQAVLAVVDPVTSQLEWANLERDIVYGHESPALADVDDDGDVEIVWRRWVYDGRTGALVGEGPEGANGRDDDYSNAGGHSFPLDLDGDRQMEIVTGAAIFAADGALRCWLEGPDGYPAAADLDGDTRGEVVVVGQHEVRVHDDDCRLLARWPSPSGMRGGPPTIADFDGDGAPEIGLADMYFYAVYEPDGTELWRHPITETSSGATGSSVFDFDGDGQAEVLYADEETLWVLHGATGAVRVAWEGHCSSTRNELPLVVDVDGDGSTEIVLAHNAHPWLECYDRGVTVLSSADDSWMPARPVWNQAAYHITNIEDDLRVPSPARPNWPTRNSFRSADLLEREGMRAPNSSPLEVELCTEACVAGTLSLTVRVASTGAEPLPAGFPVTAFSEIEGQLHPLDTIWVEEEVPPGRTTEGLVFTFPESEVPEGFVVISVDEDADGGQTFGECDDTDNTLRLREIRCP